MTELIWEGKYVDGKRQTPVRVALPFQTIETVNESTADRQRRLEFFSAGRETEWRNRLIWGDKKYVLPSLLPEFAGKMTSSISTHRLIQGPISLSLRKFPARPRWRRGHFLEGAFDHRAEGVSRYLGTGTRFLCGLVFRNSRSVE